MPTQAPPRPLRLPVLLDQQFWYLGHDIRHTDGNALQRFGFVRWRSPGEGGTSCYVYALSETPPLEAVVCWGFAAYCGPVHFALPSGTGLAAESAPQRGVLFHRHAHAPRMAAAPLTLPVHRLADLPRGHVAGSDDERHAVREAMGKMALVFNRYEQWARSTLGDRYRLDTLAALPRHKQRRFERVPDLSGFWARLAS